MAPKLPAGMKAAALLVRPPLVAMTKREWSGGEHLPKTRGFIAVSNHALLQERVF